MNYQKNKAGLVDLNKPQFREKLPLLFSARIRLDEEQREKLKKAWRDYAGMVYIEDKLYGPHSSRWLQTLPTLHIRIAEAGSGELFAVSVPPERYMDAIYTDDATDDDYVRFEHTSRRTLTSIATTAIVAVACTLGAVAIAARSGKGRAILTLLAMAGTGQAMSVEGDHPVKIHSSNFSRYSCFNSATGNNVNNTSDVTTCREHGTMDSGTTECTSGRRKLFPTKDIEEWHPRIKVEVASGVCLPVLFRGQF